MFVRSLPAIGAALVLAVVSPAAFAQTTARSPTAPPVRAIAVKPPIAWQPSRIPWVALPDGISLGPAPQTAVIPTQIYGYGVRSAPVNVFAAREPVILRLTVGDVTGSVGALIVSTDFGTTLSKEGELKPGADNVLYFRLRPGMAAGMIALRNLGPDGTPAKALIRQVAFVREVDLDNDELAELAAAGLH